MTKYEALGRYLRLQKNAYIPMTFSEIERVIGRTLPKSQCYPAWWSNNTSNNVMTKVWMDAGYRTEQVDTKGKKLVFRRVVPTPQPPPVSSAIKPADGMAEAARPFKPATERGIHPLIGALKGLLWIEPGYDLTEPALPELEKLVDGKWAGKLG